MDITEGKNLAQWCCFEHFLDTLSYFYYIKWYILK